MTTETAHIPTDEELIKGGWTLVEGSDLTAGDEEVLCLYSGGGILERRPERDTSIPTISLATAEVLERAITYETARILAKEWLDGVIIDFEQL